VVATDNGSPPLSGSQTFTVNVVPFNHPPVLATIPTQTVNEGSRLTVDVTATDSDVPAQVIAYSLGAGAPVGAAIAPQSGVLTWTPDPYAGSGTYSITVIATDNGYVPKSDSTTFTVNVLPVNHPPVFSAIPAQTAVSGQTLQLGIAQFVSDPDRPPQALQYSLAAGAPAGASIDSVSGLLTWTLPSSQHIGFYPIGVVVTDSGSPPLSQTASFMINVVDLGPAATISRARVRTKNGYAITLTFSQPLDPSTAENPNNYILTPAKHKKSKHSPVPTLIPLIVSYDPRTNAVTLTARVKVKPNQALKLTVIGEGPDGIAKVTGLPLAGNHRRPGTNYVATVTGASIKRIT
jgi:hypothetical protein